MGKKRIASKGETESSGAVKTGSSSKKRTLDKAVLYVESTYNNTKLTLTDEKGNVVGFSSSGALGFQGAKKGTPFAAAKVGETLATKAQTFGIREISVVVKGVGSGRESSIRGFVSKGFAISSIRDMTPVPHNGPRPPRARRV
ncbi:MAG: 30S ribosomal protein S11 [Candidatus Taylorbacteria bacterium CG11_big_fil_rev_8_21_14_0_20_46_11]|uniref:Small ribosomal subunit protein uS11 n=1 Tax=Candidatus Taylorbacteria bacterium CG11_big_fil_rev_8_21_14_0_20_46_11 TaxID=1975025 RepID=A0A2H0KBF8_9BACT|nr:MAG: 30S ribosomal protein S11 [Candidatus Taylorbacteria bacterium CG11_big_fil_rev_8_21_14_0_20_46_11]